MFGFLKPLCELLKFFIFVFSNWNLDVCVVEWLVTFYFCQLADRLFLLTYQALLILKLNASLYFFLFGGEMSINFLIKKNINC